MASVGAGAFSIPLRRLQSPAAWPVRALAGIRPLTQRVERMEQHLVAVSNLVLMLVAQSSASWTPEQRERVLRAVARFTMAGDGLGRAKPTGNPVTAGELDQVREYMQRAGRGESLSEEEARKFRTLAERLAGDHPQEAWATELLKVALMVYGMDVLGKAFRT